ncbi:hypothetical protein GQ53DRAFT_103832 [Thozetella sp. PMI_491]|nr:hypothetical protein GQ53DRAFT_103832 [Thozetella sp. PMI_491]
MEGKKMRGTWSPGQVYIFKFSSSPASLSNSAGMVDIVIPGGLSQVVIEGWFQPPPAMTSNSGDRPGAFSPILRMLVGRQAAWEVHTPCSGQYEAGVRGSGMRSNIIVLPKPLQNLVGRTPTIYGVIGAGEPGRDWPPANLGVLQGLGSGRIRRCFGGELVPLVAGAMMSQRLKPLHFSPPLPPSSPAAAGLLCCGLRTYQMVPDVHGGSPLWVGEPPTWLVRSRSPPHLLACDTLGETNDRIRTSREMTTTRRHTALSR